MTEAWNKIFKFTPNHKFIKIPFVIYTDTEFLPEKKFKPVIINQSCSHQK